MTAELPAHTRAQWLVTCIVPIDLARLSWVIFAKGALALLLSWQSHTGGVIFELCRTFFPLLVDNSHKHYLERSGSSHLLEAWWQARRLVTKTVFSCKQQPDGQKPCREHSWLGLGVGREVLPASKYLLLYLHSNRSSHSETLKLHIETWEVLQKSGLIGRRHSPGPFPPLSNCRAFQAPCKGNEREAIMLAAHSLMPALIKDVCAKTVPIAQDSF